MLPQHPDQTYPVVGDVARADKYKPFQLHELPNVGMLQQVTKCVYNVEHVSQIPGAINQAFALAKSGEPGPVAVVVPFTMLIVPRHSAAR